MKICQLPLKHLLKVAQHAVEDERKIAPEGLWGPKWFAGPSSAGHGTWTTMRLTLKDFAQSGFEWPACQLLLCVTCAHQPITNEALRFLPCKTRAEELSEINSGAVCRHMCTMSFWLHVSILRSCWLVCMRQQLAYNQIIFCMVNWYSLLRYPGKSCGYHSPVRMLDSPALQVIWSMGYKLTPWQGAFYVQHRHSFALLQERKEEDRLS